MAERSLLEILLRARGGGQVASETRRASSGLNRLERSSSRTSKAMHAVGRASLYAGAALGGATVVELKRSYGAWENHRKIAADTAQAIKSTGGVANVTAGHIDKLANSIQAKAAVDDDAVASGANMLLTFTRVRNEAGKGNKVFDRATHLAVDMAARFGGDSAGAFKQLGKALDDPIKGITALRRSGVSFTKEETAKIKTLEDTGHHLEAQRMILAALDKQVGGSAAAQATPLKKLQQSWGDLEKQLGQAVAPAIDDVVKKLGHVTDDAQRIFARKDLTLGQKIHLLADKDLRPLAHDLGNKLQKAVEWAAPKIAEGFAHAAPRAAAAFGKAFLHMDLWGKLLTAGFLFSKFGPGFRGAGAGGGKLLAAAVRSGPWGWAAAGAAAGFFMVFDKKARTWISNFATTQIKDASKLLPRTDNLTRAPGDVAGPHGWQAPKHKAAPMRGGGGFGAQPRAHGASARRAGVAMPNLRVSVPVPVQINIKDRPVAEANAHVELRYQARR